MAYIFTIVILIATPTIVWFGIRSFLPKWFRVPVYAAGIAGIFYILVLFSTNYYEGKAETDILEFDQAHAGVELSIEQKEERRRLFLNIIHDTGRTFAPITGAIGAIIYFFLIWLVIFAITRITNVSLSKE